MARRRVKEYPNEGYGDYMLGEKFEVNWLSTKEDRVEIDK